MRQAAFSEMTALVIDNNSNMQSIVAGMLRSITKQGRRLFREIRKSTSLKSALQALRAEEGVDLILCEVDIAGQYDGIQLLRDCYRDLRCRHLPFIMMTGNTNEETLLALAAGIKEWGAHDLLVKPFTQALLEEKIDRLLMKLNSPEELIYRKVDSVAPKAALDMIGKLEQGGLRSPKLNNIAGEKHMELGEKEKAAERFEKAVSESEVMYLAALRNYAQAQEELGNLDEALGALERLDMLSPLDVDRKLALGDLLLQTGNHEKGRKYFEQASVLAGKWGRHAEVQEKIKETLEKTSYEDPDIRTIKENLNDLKACNDVALRLRKEGRFDRAEACYDFILEHHPGNPWVLYNKAALYMVQGQYEKAAAILRTVLAAKPQFTKAVQALELCTRRSPVEPAGGDRVTQ